MLVGISRRHSCFSSSLSLIFVFDVIIKTVCPSHYHRTTVERRIWRKKPRGSRIVEIYEGSTNVYARRIGQKDPFGRVRSFKTALDSILHSLLWRCDPSSAAPKSRLLLRMLLPCSYSRYCSKASIVLLDLLSPSLLF